MKINLTKKDLEGLPDNLIKQLSVSKCLLEEFRIIEIINKNGGKVSLNQILIAWYQLTGDVIMRHIMTAKLYRMCKKKLIFAIPKSKGIYSLTTETEIKENKE